MSDVPLKEYVESQIKWLDKHFDVQLEALRQAASLALDQLNERLARMNEFRDALKDQTGLLVTRTEMALQVKSLADRLQQLELNKAGLDVKIMVITALIAIIAAGTVSFFFQHVKLA